MAELKILILFLIIVNCKKFTLCQKFDIDYYSSQEQSSEVINQNSTKISADNELTHVRTKNLSGNVKLTTLEVLTTNTPLDNLNNDYENEANEIFEKTTDEIGSMNENKQDEFQTIVENQQKLALLSEVGTKVPTDGMEPFGLMDVFNSTSGTLPDRAGTEKLIIVTQLKPELIDENSNLTEKIEIVNSTEKFVSATKNTTPYFEDEFDEVFATYLEETSDSASVTEITITTSQSTFGDFLSLNESFINEITTKTEENVDLNEEQLFTTLKHKELESSTKFTFPQINLNEENFTEKFFESTTLKSTSNAEELTFGAIRINILDLFSSYNNPTTDHQFITPNLMEDIKNNQLQEATTNKNLYLTLLPTVNFITDTNKKLDQSHEDIEDLSSFMNVDEEFLNTVINETKELEDLNGTVEDISSILKTYEDNSNFSVSAEKETIDVYEANNEEITTESIGNLENVTKFEQNLFVKENEIEEITEFFVTIETITEEETFRQFNESQIDKSVTNLITDSTITENILEETTKLEILFDNDFDHINETKPSFKEEIDSTMKYGETTTIHFESNEDDKYETTKEYNILTPNQIKEESNNYFSGIKEAKEESVRINYNKNIEYHSKYEEINEILMITENNLIKDIESIMELNYGKTTTTETVQSMVTDFEYEMSVLDDKTEKPNNHNYLSGVNNTPVNFNDNIKEKNEDQLDETENHYISTTTKFEISSKLENVETLITVNRLLEKLDTLNDDNYEKDKIEERLTEFLNKLDNFDLNELTLPTSQLTELLTQNVNAKTERTIVEETDSIMTASTKTEIFSTVAVTDFSEIAKTNQDITSTIIPNFLSSLNYDDYIDQQLSLNNNRIIPTTSINTETPNMNISAVLHNFVTSVQTNNEEFNLTTAEMLTTEEIQNDEIKEPSINISVPGKHIHFSIKIVENESNYFIPSDAFSTFQAPNIVNITWKSSNPNMNNSLELNIGNSVQLNIVKGNQMHIHKTALISETENKLEDVDANPIMLDDGIQIYFSNIEFLKTDLAHKNQFKPDALPSEPYPTKTFAGEIVGSCIGFSVITGAVVYYFIKKFKGKTRNFKPNSDA